MGSAFIALDPCNKANGCLQVIPGSHKMGRVDHVLIGNEMGNTGDALQRGADPKRVEWAIQKFGSPHFCELSPGDAIFFHSNLLHTSEANKSKTRRWSMICSYNQVQSYRHSQQYLQGQFFLRYRQKTIPCLHTITLNTVP
jgi:ectoine hydroxylase